MEIRQYQKATNLLIRKLPFSRVVSDEIFIPGVVWHSAVSFRNGVANISKDMVLWC